ncbi:ATP-binding protein [Deinococcus metalli]|uniref:ATP-binding protein n=1 Tax=Deinococcus metalli TaxID=1141878 RepID=UPI00160A2B86|nr:ATP-binding protein [Deinococcus metalli]
MTGQSAHTPHSAIWARSSTGPTPTGTGLGLSVVKHVVQTHGGQATFTPASPHGRRVTLHDQADDASAPA